MWTILCGTPPLRNRSTRKRVECGDVVLEQHRKVGDVCACKRRGVGECPPRFFVSEEFFGDRVATLQLRSAFSGDRNISGAIPPVHDEVESCLSKLNGVAAPMEAICYVFESLDLHPPVSHSHGYFAYTHSQTEDFGTRTGWTSHYGTSLVCFSR
jgi:hypothetical protein